MNHNHHRKVSLPALATLVGLLGVGLAASAWWELREQEQRDKAFPPSEQLVGPVVREIVTPAGTVLEVRIPVDPLRIGITEVQTCYVWRDAQTPSASMSCVSPTVPN
jgi:hypothetical protein